MGILKGFCGDRFGRLLVTRIFKPKRKKIYYCACLCDCGSTTTVTKSSLYCGDVKSCGCLRSDLMSLKNTKHGLTHSPEYDSWRSMKARCLNVNNPAYNRYGGAGIKICKRWMSFSNFLKDVGSRPSLSHTLERTDNGGGYCKSNVVWATKKQQARNRKSSLLIQVGGKTQCLSAWCEDLGLDYEPAIRRIATLDWAPSRALGISNAKLVKQSPL